MGKYDIDKHTRRLWPWFWQTIVNMSFIDIITGALFSNTNTSYEVKEIDIRQRVGYSIQRLSLETSLNNRFDSILKRFVVTNAGAAGGQYVYNEAEYIDPSFETYIFNEAEVGDSVYVFNENESTGSATGPFYVYAPLDLINDERQIRAWIEAVQITGTSYELIYL